MPPFLHRTATILLSATLIPHLVISTPISSAPSGPVLDLDYVSLLGTTNTTLKTNYFQGIRYAAPLSNQDRWRSVTPIEKRNDYSPGTTYNATEPGPACLQLGGLLDYPLPQSEDCLFLNVLTPMNGTSEHGLLPVAVNIHGGGYIGGSAGTSSLVYHSGGRMVEVSIQYRLGVLGFLGGADVAYNGVRNAGLLDQRVALEWVQRNIRNFGGDPTRVTIIGGSAGGGSVALQMIAGSAASPSPFSAAYASYPGIFTMLNDSQQESQYRYTLKAANCSDINCMRGLTKDEMSRVNLAVLNSSAFGPEPIPEVYTFGPVIDGSFIRDFPSLEFSRGHFQDVALMVTRDEYEGYQFGAPNRTQAEDTADARNIFPFAGDAFFSRLYQLYPESDYNSTFWQRAQWYGDWLINCPTYQMASASVDRNQNQSAVFKVVFDAGAQVHGAIDDFIISPTIDWPNANNVTLAEIMTSYHISFILHHDPNVARIESAPFWPSYSSGGAGSEADGESVGFSALKVTYTTIGPQRDPDGSAQCDFLAANSVVVGK